MVLAMSSEATAVSILIRQWIPNMPVSVLGGIIIIGVTLLNLLGADKLSKLESGLAAIKLLAIVSFIIAALLLILGLIPGTPAKGLGEIAEEPFMPGGISGIAGSILIVMFSYAGFEIIGLASSEADNPRKTIPKAIASTVLCLVGFYIVAVAVILPLIPTSELGEDISPMVAVLNRQGIGWAGTVLNVVLITAILSTMLAAMFGIGRMIRSLAGEGLAPGWLKDKKDVPHRGILFSGLAMLAGLGIGLLLPRVYLFLVSSGGFALLFTYAVIMATQLRFRKRCGCPPEGKCQMPGYPYSSWLVMAVLFAAILSMPFIPGQGTGLVTGIILIFLYSSIYLVIRHTKRVKERTRSYQITGGKSFRPGFSTEFSEELEAKKQSNDSEKKGE
jgi:L-asparagine transporter-like permease